MSIIPLSLYIHIPWCVKKCPYCDFNSHVTRQEIPEKLYLNALIDDFRTQTSYRQNREIKTVFIGGGTPSLLSPAFYHELMSVIQPYLAVDAEITMEANPGTIDTSDNKLMAYRALGINRISFGIQSLQNDKLSYLGRIHCKDDALQAIQLAKLAGFTRINADLMFGLPQQSIEDALKDLHAIIEQDLPHISWYQLTIEPNTHFYRRPPSLPDDDYIFEMQEQGQALLAKHGYEHYEVSAYAKPGYPCQHNLNYWLFGDYIGIGAGAHGKITDPITHAILRTENLKNPTLYMEKKEEYRLTKIVPKEDNLLEFMLNALRLHQAIPFTLVEERCALTREYTWAKLKKSQEEGLLHIDKKSFQLSEKGRLFVNELLLHLL